MHRWWSGQGEIGLCWIERAQTQPFSPFEAPCEDHKSPCRAGETRLPPQEDQHVGRVVYQSVVGRLQCSAEHYCTHPPTHTHPPTADAASLPVGSSNPCLSPVNLSIATAIRTVSHIDVNRHIRYPVPLLLSAASRRWLHNSPILITIGQPAVTTTPLSKPHVPRARVRGGKAGLELAGIPQSQSIQSGC